MWDELLIVAARSSAQKAVAVRDETWALPFAGGEPPRIQAGA